MMFGLFSKKPNYESIFASPEDTKKLIYGGRRKTADVLGNQDFIDAWLSSRHQKQVTSLIRIEALNGDIPSIKQMIWLGDIFYRDMANIPDATKRTQLQTFALAERIVFCEKAIGLGMTEKSYPAMMSCANLYHLSSKSFTDDASRKAISGAVRHAKLFLTLDCDDSGMIDDAKLVLRDFGPLEMIMNAKDGSAQSP